VKAKHGPWDGTGEGLSKWVGGEQGKSGSSDKGKQAGGSSEPRWKNNEGIKLIERMRPKKC